MKSLQSFIDAGWHTVPLKGELKRLSNGKKTIPIFPENFRDLYTETKNTVATALGGVMCGKCSGIIAIDCDSESSYQIFKSLDPTYSAHIVSRGKLNADGTEMAAATIVYKYTSELGENFSVVQGDFKLDFYSDRGFIYLPTEENKTKEPWPTIPEIKQMPRAILDLLKSLKPKKLAQAEVVLQHKRWVLHLAPQIKQFIEKKEVQKSLFKVLTPKDFRDMPEYLSQEYVHPNQIPDGRGSEYLMKVSAILGADESIDEEQYIDAMTIINDMFDDPMPRKRFQSTVLEPMVEGRSSINGEPIWRYNKNWEANLTTIVTKINSQLNAFFDMDRKIYYAVDIANEKVHEFANDSEIFRFIDVVAIDPMSKKEFKQALPLVSVQSTPTQPFGFFGDTKDAFNVFVPTVPLTIFRNPETYAKNYTYPATVLSFFETLVPDTYMRNYLFKFLRRKFDTFEYSPVVLYFLGASGSGKDTFVGLLEDMIGPAAIAKPSAKEFIETHNGWVLDKYFAQLDEYGDQLQRFDEKEVAKGRIKALTGKQNISVRMMREDSFPYIHNITVIMTANTHPLTLDTDDRRIALFNTPNVLRLNPIAVELGLDVFHSKLHSEINDFAYWLSVYRENATIAEYTTPPDTPEKRQLIATKLGAADRLRYLLRNAMFDDLQSLAEKYAVPQLLDHAADGRIYEDDLFDLYLEMTENKGNKRAITAVMSDTFTKVPTTKNGSKAYYYRIPSLSARSVLMKMDPIEGDFE